jgi:hypothetical protein
VSEVEVDDSGQDCSPENHQRMVMSVTDVLLKTVCNQALNRVREVRGEKIGRLVLEEGHGVDEVHRNRHRRSSLSADSDDQIRGLAASS